MTSTNPPGTALWRILSSALLACFSLTTLSQRSYKPASVLAAGNWYKFSTTAAGVYKVDAPFLSSLGITGTVPSDQIRVFAGGNAMLPEAAGKPRIDDLEEVAIQVQDGGDGVVNGNDYFLFYSEGPDKWIKDSAAKRFMHQKNLYSDKAYYFISIGGAGKRIATQTTTTTAAVTVNAFDERYFHELDTVNFLSSGKEWWGEEMSSLPGHSLSRSFALPVTDIVSGSATIVASVAARSVNVGSHFSVSLNNGLAQQISVRSIGTSQYEAFAQETVQTNTIAVSDPGASLSFAYTLGSFNSQGWLNWFELFCRRNLVLGNGVQLSFRDWNTVGNTVVGFNITTANAATEVWDVTELFAPVKMNATIAGNSLRFTADALRLREYIAFSSTFLTPKAEGRVTNQNLHSTAEADYLIVTAPAFLSQAQRLAQFHHQRENLSTVVVTTEQVFNEFSGGIPDPTAIRDFAKMYFDRYKSNWDKTGKYLLLFGKGSFDYKNRIQGNTNFVPAYESNASLDPLGTYTSDDFFGFLEDAEDINSFAVVNTLDIGIGRIPAKDVDEAEDFVDKLIAYHSPSAFGPWRTTLNFIADDEDQNLHLQDAEKVTATATTTAPVFNLQKIYLDAFQQESGSAGGRYPSANIVINSNIDNGTLIWNYNGHGGPQRLAEEVVLDASIVNSWSNATRLPLFITATCDFATYDNPLSASLGEDLLVRPKTGAIALMTTSRVVFASSNRILNDNYLKTALKPDASNRYKTLGEAVRDTKNLTYTTSSDIVNNRKFSLLGDPATTLSFPQFQVKATKVNGRDIAAATDTLSATSFVTVEGEVQEANTILSDFAGMVYLTVFDKEKSVTTLGNDPGSQPVSFLDQSAALFRGKASVTGGRFSVRFRLPKDINFQYGSGKLSLYAEDGKRDGMGFTNNVVIGGIASGASGDNAGPDIKAYLNDERFVAGGLTNEAPVLILKLTDSSGINTGSSGIDHDIVATLDNNTSEYFVLNNFYESDLDNYQKGTVRFSLPSLLPGSHTLKIKAWDVLNNSSETVLPFTVMNNEALHLAHVLNYPNPFTTHTAFWFEHNYSGIDLYSKVEIFTVGGKLLKTIAKTINTAGNRSIELEWDGRDEWGEKLGRGVYLYRLWVKAANGKTASQWGKLALLQ